MADARPVVGPSGADAVVTVGTFDGLHRGHRALIDAVLDAAAATGAPSVVVTFDPHPLQVVRPESAPDLLTPPREKVALLTQLGVDRLVLLRFDRHLADLTAERFVEEILLRRIGTRRLVVGYDHGFGRGRSGDVEMLRALGAKAGFEVQTVAPVLRDGAPVSSTRIRKALADGDLAAATSDLGRPYAIRGTVVHGDGRGHALGYPTANLKLPESSKLLPRDGIYAVRADIAGVLHDGVLHLGPRPTYPGATATIELHVFDWDGDLYGRSVEVRFCARLRGIERFVDAAGLVAAIEADCGAARRVFERGAGACG